MEVKTSDKIFKAEFSPRMAKGLKIEMKEFDTVYCILFYKDSCFKIWFESVWNQKNCCI
jgi:hypothetical protein